MAREHSLNVLYGRAPSMQGSFEPYLSTIDLSEIAMVSSFLSPNQAVRQSLAAIARSGNVSKLPLPLTRLTVKKPLLAAFPALEFPLGA